MISIVVTCYNESDIINEFIISLNKEISKIKEDFEIIFVDNKSGDNTLEIIKSKIDLFKKYKIITLSNYFGKESDYYQNMMAAILMQGLMLKYQILPSY